MSVRTIDHCPTGIAGLDEITNGGLPAGRTTLISGGPGCGKTLFGTTFLINGARRGEPGVFIAFEEREHDLITNAASLGYDLEHLVSEGLIALDYVQVDRDQIFQTGDFGLEALFIRLDHFYYWFVFLIQLNMAFTSAGLVAWSRDTRYERSLEATHAA